MGRYLIQDHRFLDSFLTLLGAVLASADTFAARLRLGHFIGMVSSDGNTYFLRAFEALGVPEVRRAADPDTQATAGFKAIMREAAETRSHAAVLSVLVVAEWLYLDRPPARRSRAPDNFVHAEVDHAAGQSSGANQTLGTRLEGPLATQSGHSRAQLPLARSYPTGLICRRRPDIAASVPPENFGANVS